MKNLIIIFNAVSVIFLVEGALGQLANILPDYILPFAITVLSHSNILEDCTNISELQVVEKCLNFILEPLISNKDTFCFSLYTNMIEKMKHAKSAYQPHNDDVNEVSFIELFGWII
jgi:sister chromatid cohesion protein PDS5